MSPADQTSRDGPCARCGSRVITRCWDCKTFYCERHLAQTGSEADEDFCRACIGGGQPDDLLIFWSDLTDEAQDRISRALDIDYPSETSDLFPMVIPHDDDDEPRGDA